MIDLIFGNMLASVLVYVPYALLYLYAFRKNLRFSMPVTMGILVFSTVLRLFFIQWARHSSPEAVSLYNYLDMIVILVFGVLSVKSHHGRRLFIGLMLKNTADAVVIIAKFLESLVSRDWAMMGYHWTYSVSLILVSALLLPAVYYIIQRFFGSDILDRISHRWRILWVVPFFFYLTWVYVFFLSPHHDRSGTGLHPCELHLPSLFHCLPIPDLRLSGFPGPDAAA